MWVISFVVFSICSYFLEFKPGLVIFSNFNEFFIEMISFIPFLFIIIGLFDVWFPKEVLEKHIGRESGVKGVFLVILLAMFQAGPLYGAFPVAYVLYKKGCICKEYFHLFRSFFIDEITYVRNRNRLFGSEIYNFKNINIFTHIYLHRICYGENTWQWF